MSQRVIVSNPNNDALTTTGTAVSFSSDYASHSIYNVASLTVGSAETAGTISHNLGFFPKTWVYYSNNDGGTIWNLRLPANGPGFGEDYYIGTNNIVIERGTGLVNRTYNVVIFTRSPNP